MVRTIPTEQHNRSAALVRALRCRHGLGADEQPLSVFGSAVIDDRTVAVTREADEMYHLLVVPYLEAYEARLALSHSIECGLLTRSAPSWVRGCWGADAYVVIGDGIVVPLCWIDAVLCAVSVTVRRPSHAALSARRRRRRRRAAKRDSQSAERRRSRAWLHTNRRIERMALLQQLI